MYVRSLGVIHKLKDKGGKGTAHTFSHISASQLDSFYKSQCERLSVKNCQEVPTISYIYPQ
jgi:hypothetical protein